MAFRFPDGFVWGTATAAHQVEGNNTNCDFWVMEHTPGTLFAEPSGDAVDHFHRYPEDRLLKQLGFGAYRFSIEWARVEPEEGHFSTAALDHYRRMLACCLENGITPCVTFHHFTSPIWFSADGGWEDVTNVDRFARYCERTVNHLGDLRRVSQRRLEIGCRLRRRVGQALQLHARTFRSVLPRPPDEAARYDAEGA
jgi:beta-glucosidase